MALVVIIGGARSGKSSIAEALAKQRLDLGSEVSVAVFGNPDGDDVEFAERIKHHRENRPPEFETVEGFDKADWLAEIADDGLLVIDCLGTALSAMMANAQQTETSFDSIAAPSVGTTEADFMELLERIANRGGDTIVVSNEVGSGLVPEYESGRIFRDILGRGNRYLVARADAAYLCVCGRLIALDALPAQAAWPED